ncbi:MAG: hypothetical protein JW940_11015 [Polyangiaceae bacterium]|nr:hypothetical protein [Polyangiaceae bacterium]
MRRPILVVLFVALSSACASARPPAAAPAPQSGAERVHAKPVEVQALAPVASPPSLDPIREQRRAEEQREQEQDAALREAEQLFVQFIDKAGDDPAYAEAVQRSRERVADIEEILRFRAQGRLERARAEHAQ